MTVSVTGPGFAFELAQTRLKISRVFHHFDVAPTVRVQRQAAPWAARCDEQVAALAKALGSFQRGPLLQDPTPNKSRNPNRIDLRRLAVEERGDGALFLTRGGIANRPVRIASPPRPNRVMPFAAT